MNEPHWALSPETLQADFLRLGMSLLPPPEVLDKIPPLYGTEATPTDETVIWAHYFLLAADWWIAELDPESGMAFGYACLGDPGLAEWGYVSLVELSQLVASPRHPISVNGELVEIEVDLVVERELDWRPVKVSECERLQQVMRIGGQA